jgi:hypothetical protein
MKRELGGNQQNPESQSPIPKQAYLSGVSSRCPGSHREPDKSESQKRWIQRIYFSRQRDVFLIKNPVGQSSQNHSKSVEIEGHTYEYVRATS